MQQKIAALAIATFSTLTFAQGGPSSASTIPSARVTSITPGASAEKKAEMPKFAEPAVAEARETPAAKPVKDEKQTKKTKTTKKRSKSHTARLAKK